MRFSISGVFTSLLLIPSIVYANPWNYTAGQIQQLEWAATPPKMTIIQVDPLAVVVGPPEDPEEDPTPTYTSIATKVWAYVPYSINDTLLPNWAGFPTHLSSLSGKYEYPAFAQYFWNSYYSGAPNYYNFTVSDKLFGYGGKFSYQSNRPALGAFDLKLMNETVSKPYQTLSELTTSIYDPTTGYSILFDVHGNRLVYPSGSSFTFTPDVGYIKTATFAADHSVKTDMNLTYYSMPTPTSAAPVTTSQVKKFDHVVTGTIDDTYLRALPATSCLKASAGYIPATSVPWCWSDFPDGYYYSYEQDWQVNGTFLSDGSPSNTVLYSGQPFSGPPSSSQCPTGAYDSSFIWDGRGFYLKGDMSIYGYPSFPILSTSVVRRGTVYDYTGWNFTGPAALSSLPTPSNRVPPWIVTNLLRDPHPGWNLTGAFQWGCTPSGVFVQGAPTAPSQPAAGFNYLSGETRDREAKWNTTNYPTLSDELYKYWTIARIKPLLPANPEQVKVVWDPYTPSLSSMAKVRAYYDAVFNAFKTSVSKKFSTTPSLPAGTSIYTYKLSPKGEDQHVDLAVWGPILSKFSPVMYALMLAVYARKVFLRQRRGNF